MNLLYVKYLVLVALVVSGVQHVDCVTLSECKERKKKRKGKREKRERERGRGRAFVEGEGGHRLIGYNITGG